VCIRHRIDVRAIRTRLRMTQEEFATGFGFSINTPLGTRQATAGRPRGAYLLVIDRAPKAVQKALRAAWSFMPVADEAAVAALRVARPARSTRRVLIFRIICKI
jgi:hypothetical protein